MSVLDQRAVLERIQYFEEEAEATKQAYWKMREAELLLRQATGALADYGYLPPATLNADAIAKVRELAEASLARLRTADAELATLTGLPFGATRATSVPSAPSDAKEQEYLLWGVPQ
jgi:hypothetical protein